VLDYLIEEVLEQQSESVQAFLLRTSILDRMCGPLCDAVLPAPSTSGQETLEYLERTNLFIVPLDSERRWYRYHHLFGDLLRNQLARSQPEWIPELHQRASRWYEEKGDIQAAVDHALQDTDLTQAAYLIEQHAIPKLYQGEVTMVVGWFDRLPEEILESAPMLCIDKAWALVLMQRSTRSGEVRPALHAADHALDRVNAGEALRDLVAGHAASIQAFLLRQSALVGETPEKVIALSRDAQQLLPDQERGIRSVNSLNIGYAYLALADLQAAEHTVQPMLVMDATEFILGERIQRVAGVG